MTREVLLKAASRLARPLASTLFIGGALILLVGPGCGEEGIGDPCTPEQEYNSDFLGFDAKEINIESKSFQCRTRVCLVNHFQGRVSCPYGQGSGAEAPTGGKPCAVPGSETAVSGEKICQDATGKACQTNSDCSGGATCDFRDKQKQSLVQPQCLDRTSDKAVYCSCRCADKDGNKPSGQTFCDCPSGFSCERLVTPTGLGNEGLTGSYCIKQNTKYEAATACSVGVCDKSSPDAAKNCGE